MWVLWEKKVVPQPFFSGPRGAAHGVPSDLATPPGPKAFQSTAPWKLAAVPLARL